MNMYILYMCNAEKTQSQLKKRNEKKILFVEK